RQSLARRFAIVVAGPLANFILAFLIYWGLYLYGVPGLVPYVDVPPPGTVAAGAGFQAGERITRVDREPVATWNDVQMRLIDQALERGHLEIETQDSAGHIALHELDLSQLQTEQRDADLLDQVGLKPWDFPIPPEAGRVLPDSPAGQAGLQVGDRILAVDGQPLASWQALVKIVRASAGHSLTLTLERQGTPRIGTLTPRAEQGERGEVVGKIGLSPRLSPELNARYWTTVREGPITALLQAGSKTWEVIRLTFKTFGAMVIGEASWKNVGGPIQIADYAGQSARLGAIPYLTFIALISISLGALNLLPVPLLDGGHLMYYVVELIKGSPVSDRTLALTQRIGLMVLTALMGFALYNDIQRLLTN
ncbi:MAG: RIP metalloprotease RseP, partial [Ferrovum sp.]|nr:RIP metalloprotease RseP [Ferrovum sp.]